MVVYSLASRSTHIFVWFFSPRRNTPWEPQRGFAAWMFDYNSYSPNTIELQNVVLEVQSWNPDACTREPCGHYSPCGTNENTVVEITPEIVKNIKYCFEYRYACFPSDYCSTTCLPHLVTNVIQANYVDPIVAGPQKIARRKLIENSKNLIRTSFPLFGISTLLHWQKPNPNRFALRPDQLNMNKYRVIFKTSLGFSIPCDRPNNYFNRRSICE